MPTAERTLDPARMFMESLTPRPELENSLGGAASLVMGRGDGSNGCYSERPNRPERPIEW